MLQPGWAAEQALPEPIVGLRSTRSVCGKRSASPCFASLLPEEELRLCCTKLSVASRFPMQFQQKRIRCCFFEMPFHLQGGRIIMLR